MLLRHEGDQVHALRSQPAGVDRHVIAQRVRPIHAEEALVELASLQVDLFDQRPRRIFGQPAMLHHPPQTNLQVRDQTDVECPRIILQEPATTTTDEECVSLGCELLDELGKGLEAALVQAARTKSLEEPGRLLIDLLQLRQADTQPPRLVREQFAVEHRQPEPLGQRRRQAGVSGSQLARQRHDPPLGGRIGLGWRPLLAQ